MNARSSIGVAFLFLLMALGTLRTTGQQPRAVPAVDDAALRNAAATGHEWLTYGRDYAETRYSSLREIDSGNVERLGLTMVWPTRALGALEATPLVSNGVLYGTLSYGAVFAFDLRSGKILWEYDPDVPLEIQQRACCGVVNRGVALYQGRVFVGVLDGRVVALDAQTGRVAWEVQATPRDEWYTITMAPRIVKGKVVVGVSGGEYAVRGFFDAYDTNSGNRIWRFYTVPGDPSLPFENPALERAAKTWTGEWWKMGGGGTVWDAIAYDPDADLMYVGVGNGGPWNRDFRSPDGGDNLYLASILAVRPDSGELVWHYQTTPGDHWDYTAVQHIMLADLTIEGMPRRVLMQAPKNGFFYVIDRISGQFISAEPFANVTWAAGIDKTTGRPIENPGARYTLTEGALVSPGPGGAHNWHPMSWNPNTGLVYIPGQNSTAGYTATPNFLFRANVWNTGVTMNAADLKPLPAIGPPPVEGQPGFLVAWDPVTQKERWRVPYSAGFNGGTLSTAGNLVFHGTADGRLIAYSADAGVKRWEMALGVRNMAAPVTYELDGKQYVAILGGRAANPAAGLRGGAGIAGQDQSGPSPKLFIFGLDGRKSVEEALGAGGL